MSLQIIELVNSRTEIVAKSATFSYALNETNHTDNPTANSAIEILVFATAPLLFRGLRRENELQIKHKEEVHFVNVSYKKVENEEDDGLKISLDLAGGSATVKHSLETINTYDSDHVLDGPNPPDGPPFHDGLIGVNGDSVEGVTIPIPSFQFTVTRYIPDTQINNFLNNMLKLQALVNNDAVSFSARGWEPTFQPGELLFLGGNAVPRDGTDEEDWEVPMRFEARANVTDLQLAGFELRTIEKDGHDYLWVTHGDSHDTISNSLARTPRAAYIERVIPRANLGSLFN